MTKIITQLFSTVLALMISITMVMSVSAEVATSTAKTYTIGTTVTSADLNGNYRSFKFTIYRKTTLYESLTNTSYNDYNNNRYNNCSLTGNFSTAYPDYIKGNADIMGSESIWAEGGKNLEATLVYTLEPDTYVFYVNSGERITFSTTPPNSAFSAPINFKSGVVAPNIKTTKVLYKSSRSYEIADLIEDKVGEISSNPPKTIEVTWGAVNSAKYAVYSIYRNDITGKFSNWSVSSTDTTSYTISNPLSDTTYYVTILPYMDIPSRQYGGFSAYEQITTTYRR